MAAAARENRLTKPHVSEVMEAAAWILPMFVSVFGSVKVAPSMNLVSFTAIVWNLVCTEFHRKFYFFTG